MSTRSSIKNSSIKKKNTSELGTSSRVLIYLILIFLALVFLGPILFVLINSFKAKFSIADNPFALPLGDMYVGVENYAKGLAVSGTLSAVLWSAVITVLSVMAIVFFSSMTAYYIARVRTWWTKALYFVFVFSMVVPFQMVMFPSAKIADLLYLANPLGMAVLYLGFGAGLSVFIFVGFLKTIPTEIEEAASIDGCSPLQIYFRVVLPMLKPTMITVGILNTMWIWNDYLLPNLVLGAGSKYRTIPIVLQFLVGSNGNRDMGAMMAMLVLAIIPIVIFYVLGQKYIIEGVAAGAVKG
ncbi:carbohydrate ABC transporter permease [Corynebacterium sp. sy017]|uniref:carbohydrate ABC transporter permease n=1 Tax=unclassified Corynebacterium TaxID=2624378 RepID=UPI001184B919|nr:MULTISPECIES: carbohydrate ABC transporter permease [unclassified Corynebacterium]MBP3088108.1 carbohydrate ABC transporter permease [Corynebacterium sp. sy017]QDZ43056.1 carbohydrate ABC transporter permease [Corynebacterium sp. sy039]TSD92631.1 carbohydrate ABC transporter permease [Corynebacterium sp. SY003]